jgi:hypothetical protein
VGKWDELAKRINGTVRSSLRGLSNNNIAISRGSFGYRAFAAALAFSTNLVTWMRLNGVCATDAA